MKHLLEMLSVSTGTVFIAFLAISSIEAQDLRIPPPPIERNNGIESGKWEFSESFTNHDSDKSSSSWEFEVIDEGAKTVIALGKRLDIDGVKLGYKSEAILVIDRHDGGKLTGLYFEVDQNGQQILLPMKIELQKPGKTMTITTQDSKSNEVKSTFIGKWVSYSEERRPLKQGSWTLRETVSPDQGGYNIVWTYKLNEVNKGIYGSGKKTFINGRRAHPNERETVCDIFLQRDEFNPDIIGGTGTEKSPHTKTYYAAYDGWISPSGERFVVFSYENKELAAILIGEFKE